jgi:hypothetical protein
VGRGRGGSTILDWDDDVGWRRQRSCKAGEPDFHLQRDKPTILLMEARKEEVVVEDDIAANNVYGVMPAGNTTTARHLWITTGA